MPFNSLQYFLFLPLVYAVFHVVPQRARWGVLLVVSLVFYAALKVPYLLLVLLLVAAVTYWFGIKIDEAPDHAGKRRWLWCGVLSNLLVLFFMKYERFLLESIGAVSELFPLEVKTGHVTALVAIGVSYYIFQAISYLVDIYLEIEKAERHLGYFTVYMAFFPKLLQGPIERAGDMIPQLKKRYQYNDCNVRLGMLLLSWGLLKKVVVADRLALYVNAVYNDVHSFAGLPLLLATYAYAFQIYTDFSGYTDMALGSALLFNIKLTQNFNSPYLATSVAEFWRRWHITFSRWILDYIFKPLQMQWRDRRQVGTAMALLVAFLLSGLWHGASWGFVIWGGLHGLYMACSVFYKPYQKKLHKALRIEKTRFQKIWMMFVTFNLVSFAWVFFRANTVGDAFYLLSNLWPVEGVDVGSFLAIRSPMDLAILAGFAAVSVAVSCFRKGLSLLELPLWVRWPAYYALGAAILILGRSTESYIYFRF